MAFAVIETADTAPDTSTSRYGHIDDLPANLSDGDDITLVIEITGSNTITVPPADFTLINTPAVHGSITTYVYGAHVGEDAGEIDPTDTTFAFETSAWTRATCIALRITGSDFSAQMPEYADATQSAADPDSPDLEPTGGAKDYRWITGWTSNATETITSEPTNYTEINHYHPVTEGIALAHRALNAASEDPGAWDCTYGIYRCFTIAIHPVGGETASGGSTAAVTVTAEGAGTKTASSGADAAVTVTGEGAGLKTIEAGSTAAVTVTGEGAGLKTISSGADAVVTVTGEGAGTKSTSSGADAVVTVTGEGAGTKTISSGADAVVTVTGEGAGTKSTSSGADAVVTVTGEGAGLKTISSGADAVVTVTGEGAGTKTISSGADAVVTVTGEGAGTKSTSSGADAAVTVTATGAGEGYRAVGRFPIPGATANPMIGVPGSSGEGAPALTRSGHGPATSSNGHGPAGSTPGHGPAATVPTE